MLRPHVIESLHGSKLTIEDRQKYLRVKRDVSNGAVLIGRLPKMEVQIGGSISNATIDLAGKGGRLEVGGSVKAAVLLLDGCNLLVKGAISANHVHIRNASTVTINECLTGSILLEPPRTHNTSFHDKSTYCTVPFGGDIDRFPYLLPGSVHIRLAKPTSRQASDPAYILKRRDITEPAARREYFQKIKQALDKNCPYCKELRPKLRFQS